MVAIQRRCVVSMFTVISSLPASEGVRSAFAPVSSVDDICVDDVCLLQRQVERAAVGPTDFDDEDAAPPVQRAQNDIGEDAVSHSGSAFLAQQPGAKPPVLATPPQVVVNRRDPFFDDEDADLFNVPASSYATDLIGTSTDVAHKGQMQQTDQRAQFLAEEQEQWEAEQEAEQQGQFGAEKEAEQQAKQRAELLIQLTQRQQVTNDLPTENIQNIRHTEKVPSQHSDFGGPTADEAVSQARMFFEEQGNLGEKIDASLKQAAVLDKQLLPRISAEPFNERILPPLVSAKEQPKGLSFAQVSSGSVSKAASELSKGHSLSGRFRAPGSPPTTGQTGEEGELYGTFVDPNLMRLAFPQKSESQLYAERRIYQAQDHVAHVQQNVSEAFGKLKAEVYHSADETMIREQETAKVETSLRRAELLTDANQYRAQLAHDSRLEAQSTASLERAAHLATESVQQERELREAAESRAQREEDARIAAVGRASADETVSVQQSQEEAERVLDIERGTLESMTENTLSSGAAVADVVGSYQNFDEALDDAGLEAARRRADLEHWFGVASSVAEGVPLTQASIPVVQPSTAQEVFGRTVTPITTREEGTSAGLFINQPQSSGAVPMTQFSMPATPQMAPSSSQQVVGHTITPITIPMDGTNTGVSMSMTSARMQNGQEHSANLALMTTHSTLDSLADSSSAVGESSCQPGSAVWPSCASSASTHGPEHSACTPQCTWQCDTPRCDEVCEPQCQPPRCETRCSGLDTSACVMECDEPHCAVACPANQCPTGGCATCSATCSEPMCKLRCPNTQPCRNVCEEPSCEWHCRAPDECPAPQCHMVCEAPPSCMGSTYRQMPPLAPGETSVQSFAAPPGLPGTTGANTPPTVQVPVMSNMQQSGGAASEFQRHTVVTMPAISTGMSGR